MLGMLTVSLSFAAASPDVAADSARTLVSLKQQFATNDGAAGDGLGYSVAVRGNIAVVGAPYATVGGNQAQGAVYVFQGVGGSWVQVQKLTVDDGAAFDQFGAAVAFDGTTVIVGAPDAAVNGNAAQGAAYVFSEVAGVWTQTQKLLATNGAGSNEFGSAVAVRGDTALIGAVQLLNGPGAAYIFTNSGGTWTQAQELTAENGSGTFGDAVALGDNTALIGAQQTDVGGVFDRGAAFVFTNNNGTWTQAAELDATDGARFDSLGSSVALNGTTALIGAPGATVNGSQEGAAYIFTENNGTWTQTQKLTASDAQYLDGFGSSVALSGAKALIGAPQYYSDGTGKVYVFTKPDESWTQKWELRASHGATDADFGWSVALDHRDVLIGAWGATVNGNAGQGAAYFSRLQRSH